jgi:hypothetical protein
MACGGIMLHYKIRVKHVKFNQKVAELIRFNFPDALSQVINGVLYVSFDERYEDLLDEVLLAIPEIVEWQYCRW